jgi:hypothetical protein
MSDRIEQSYYAITSRSGCWRYRATEQLKRLTRAWGYFSGRMSADDAQRIMLDCRDSAGWYPLLVLTVEDTLEQATGTFVDHPELPRLIADGCARVGDKWESYNDELYTAREWAIDLAQRYAGEEGIKLLLRDEEVQTANTE